MQFFIDCEVFQTVQGVFGPEEAESSRIFLSQRDFCRAFPDLLRRMKAGSVHELYTADDAGNVYQITSAPGLFFYVADVFGDFETCNHRPLRADAALRLILAPFVQVPAEKANAA